MTPAQEAKRLVGNIFASVRSFPEDVNWYEKVRGGYHAEAGITGGLIVADVGYDGEFAVYAGQPDHSFEDLLKPGAICLISGSCAPRTINQVSNRPEDAVKAAEPISEDL